MSSNPDAKGWSPLEIGLAIAAVVLVGAIGIIGFSVLTGGSGETAQTAGASQAAVQSSGTQSAAGDWDTFDARLSRAGRELNLILT